MLTEIDGREDLKGVVVVGATNWPDIIDEALLRPGRLDRILEIPKPDGEGRRQILQIHTKKKPLDRSVDQERLVELTDGMTGADIVGMVNAAAMSAIKERVSSGKEDDKSKLKITMEHFEDAIEKMKVQRKSAGRLHSLT